MYTKTFENNKFFFLQISQPDPVDVRQYPHTSVSPHEPHMGREFFGTWPDSGVGSDSSNKKINVKKKGRQKKKKKSVKILENGEGSMDKTSVVKDTKSDEGRHKINDNVFENVGSVEHNVGFNGTAHNQNHTESNQEQIKEKGDVGGKEDTSGNCDGSVNREGLVVNGVSDVHSGKTTGGSGAQNDIVQGGFNTDVSTIREESQDNVTRQDPTDDHELCASGGNDNSSDVYPERRSSQAFDIKDFNSPGKTGPLQPELSSVTAVGKCVCLISKTFVCLTPAEQKYYHHKYYTVEIGA